MPCQLLRRWKRKVSNICIWYSNNSSWGAGWIHIKFALLSSNEIVLAMESQAEALGELTSDDLEGKVPFISFLLSPFSSSKLLKISDKG